MPVLQNPEFLSKNQVLFIHNRQIEKFGGEPGILNEGALDSAISQPMQQFGGCLLHPSLESQCAAYLFYLSKAHAFVDGNKRTSIASAEFFLRKNMFFLDMSIQLTYDIVLSIVTHKIDKDYLTDIIERHIKPMKNHPYLGSRYQ